MDPKSFAPVPQRPCLSRGATSELSHTNPLQIRDCERRLAEIWTTCREARHILQVDELGPLRDGRGVFRWPTSEETERARQLLCEVGNTYDQALAPAGPDFVNQLYAALAVSYPGAKLTDAEASLQLSVFIEMLAPVPADLLATAARSALKTSRFFPTIAELLAADSENSIMALHECRQKCRNEIARILSKPARERDEARDPAL